jgi:2-octaprenyl-6-methoxyphenol hydroxylase
MMSQLSSTPAEHFDVAIIGGGLVGASLACALAPLRLKIALLEAVPPRAAAQPSYDDRTLALSASSCRILQGLAVWPLLQENATAIREISVSERERPGRVVLHPRELGLDSFGHVVEARVFGAAVMAVLSAMKTVEFICPAAVSTIACNAQTARVRFARNGQYRSLEARLLVGADGADSVVREALGIATARHDYRQTAVICNISTQKPHQGRAFECFTPTGPFALLPHVNERCGLVWTVASEDAAGVLALPDDEFLRRAQSLFGAALGAWLKVGKRSAYPLRLVRALEDTRPRAVIIGNAAHAIHPVGAQGFNLGLRDVAGLAEVIAAALAQDPAADIGRAQLLQTYSDWRAPDQAETIAYADGLVRLYANPTGLAAMARSLGLLAYSLLPPLRRQLAIRAMGYRGRVPRLALGETLAPE